LRLHAQEQFCRRGEPHEDEDPDEVDLDCRLWLGCFSGSKGVQSDFGCWEPAGEAWLPSLGRSLFTIDHQREVRSVCENPSKYMMQVKTFEFSIFGNHFESKTADYCPKS